MLSKFGGGGDKKIEKKWVLGEKLESMNYKGTKHLLTFVSGGHIPIIFLTIKSGKEDVEKVYKAGGDWYLAKPFNRKELLTAVSVLLHPDYHYTR